jgi:hypothetical protein
LNFIRKIVVAALIFGGGFALGSVIVSSADGLIDPNQPGSVNDPLVTKSYVDEQVAKAVKTELEKQKSGSSASRDLVVVELNPGESLIAGTGTEFIVRNGKAVAIGGKDGIPDITDGDSIADGETIPLNHLLLFPRDDGRGIMPHADQKSTVFVMVRGKYVHLDASGKAK